MGKPVWLKKTKNFALNNISALKGGGKNGDLEEDTGRNNFSKQKISSSAGNANSDGGNKMEETGRSSNVGGIPDGGVAVLSRAGYPSSPSVGNNSRYSNARTTYPSSVGKQSSNPIIEGDFLQNLNDVEQGVSGEKDAGSYHGSLSSFDSSHSGDTGGTSTREESETDNDEETDENDGRKKSRGRSRNKSSSKENDSGTEYSNENAVSRTKNGDSSAHLNSLFNGHLMKWKFEAEEGSPFLRVPAFFAAVGMVATCTADLVFNMDVNEWPISNYVIIFFIYLSSLIVMVLDGRFLCSSPLNIRAHLRKALTSHFNIFRYLWGRSLLYLTAGILSASLLQPMTMISGAAALLVGFISLIMGSYASRKFSSLRNSLVDESFLLLEFSNHDYEQDGYITASEFSNLIESLGMGLDDRYSLKAFQAIDRDHDRKISYEEFAEWWNLGYVERGRRTQKTEHKVGSLGSDYYRFS